MDNNFKPNEIMAFLNGKKFTDVDGIEGVFEHSVYEARYPYQHTVERLNHKPTAKGKRTPAYNAIRRELGDDWSTDYTDNIEGYIDAAFKLGYHPQAKAA